MSYRCIFLSSEFLVVELPKLDENSRRLYNFYHRVWRKSEFHFISCQEIPSDECLL